MLIFILAAPATSPSAQNEPDPAAQWNAGLRRLLTERDYSGAARFIKQELPRRQNDFAFLNLLGAILDRAGKAEEAAANYEQSLAVRPQSTTVRLNLALNLVRRGQFQQAAGEFARILKEDTLQSTREPTYQQCPDDETVSAFVAAVPARERDWYELGVMLLRHGRPIAAQTVLGSAVALFSNSALLHYGHGWALQEGGRFEDARKAFSRALALRPVYPEAWLRLGFAHYIQGDYDGAIRGYEKLLAVAPENYEGHYFMALALMKRGPDSFDAAAERLKKATSLNPQSFDSYVELGKIYLQRGKLPEAREALELARRLNAGLEKAQYLLAQVYERQGNAAMADLARSALNDLKRQERVRAREIMDADLFWNAQADPSELARKVSQFYENYQAAILSGDYLRIWRWMTPESRELYDGDPEQFVQVAGRVFGDAATLGLVRRSRPEGGKLVAGRIILEFSASAPKRLGPLVLVESDGELRIDWAFEWTTAGLGYLGAR